MPSFRYTAIDGAGARVAGVLAGASEQAVLAELETRQLTPVSLAPQRERAASGGSRISSRRLSMVYTQIADLLRAGVPLMRALRLMAGRKSQPRIASVFTEISDAVAEGAELSDAMANRPDVFPVAHVAMVRAGEQGGFLEGALAQLGEFTHRQAELRGKIIGNLIYPTVLVVFGSAVLGAIFGIGVPMFRPMFERIEDQLPLISKVMFAISDAVTRHGLVTVGVLAVLAVILWRLSKRADVARKLAEIRTKAPIAGSLIRAVACARFCRTLGTLLRGGAPVLQALSIARDAAGNLLMAEAIDEAAESVRAGHSLAAPLGASGLFPEDVIEMIDVAESANNLGPVLVTIAETIESRIDRMLSTAVRLIEPLLLGAIAIVVLFVALGLILPMSMLSGAAGA
ncbi:MAG: type II secretion system F family protein [Phycisphaerales bacterium JB039]